MAAGAAKRTHALQCRWATGLGAKAFAEILDQIQPRLRTAVEANPHWLERIDDRLGQGLFEFRGASLLTYWLGSKLESDIVTDWPLPASKKDVTRVLSDLGIAE